MKSFLFMKVLVTRSLNCSPVDHMGCCSIYASRPSLSFIAPFSTPGNVPVQAINYFTVVIISFFQGLCFLGVFIYHLI